ncbi:hypothetical protein QYM36_019786 [Artemia franciscana]|uniref:Uncharacterized protein n=1 Tax=Artemia franciscana TaxID=6661 RepID=A0AA88KZ20_ARTSF|nr:hypothetical protein QYM36_019786 [Artemia franciscana]
MASAGHHKYATYLTMYLQDMERVSKQLCGQSLQGHFTLKRSVGSAKAVSPDHALKPSLNLEGKQKGGIKGLTLNAIAIAKWISTLPFSVKVSASLCKLAGINGNSEYDGSEKADFQNEKFVLKTMSVVETYVNPFDYSLLAAEENGLRAVEAFVAGHPNPFSKIKVVTMASSLKKGKEQMQKAFSYIQEELEAIREILLACGSAAATSLSVLRRLMPHELLPVSPTLFERTGTGAGIWLRMGSTAALIDSIRMPSAIYSWPMNVTLRPEAKQAVLLDFMAFIGTQSPWKTETLENFACPNLKHSEKILVYVTNFYVDGQQFTEATNEACLNVKTLLLKDICCKAFFFTELLSLWYISITLTQ